MARKLRNSNRNWAFESLESRWMMAGDPMITYNPNAPGLHLDGTVGSDNVLVSISGDHLKITTNTNRGEFFDRYVLLSSLSKPIIYFNGGNGNDTFFNSTTFECYAWGGAGRDSLTSNEATCKFFGEEGDDDLFANGLNSLLVGGEGNDDIYCSEGRAYGGEGNDALEGRNLFGGLGNDTLLGTDAGWFDGGLGDDYIRGSQFGDHLIGGPEMRPSCEFTDNDYLDGLGGQDFLWGGDGEDYLDGGVTRTHIGAGEYMRSTNDYENDLIRGGIGADTFRMRFRGDYSTQEDSIFDFNSNEGDRVTSSHNVSLDEGVFELPRYKTFGTMEFAGDMSWFAPEMGPAASLVEYQVAYGADELTYEEVTFSVHIGEEIGEEWLTEVSWLEQSWSPEWSLAELPLLSEDTFFGETLEPFEIELVDFSITDQPLFDENGLLLADLPNIIEPETTEEVPPLTDPIEALDLAFAELFYSAPTISRNSLRVGNFWR